MKQEGRLERLNRSGLITGLILLLIFGILLLCNCKTRMVADDYAYCFGFDDGQRIESLADCARSMAAHRQWMNGRILAHFLVQLFLLLPPGLFKIANSLVFTAVIVLLFRLAGGERNNLLLAGIFGCVWIFMPAFGQVILWLDGAVNYLWSAFFSLILLSLYAKDFMGGKDRTEKPSYIYIYIGGEARACSDGLPRFLAFSWVPILNRQQWLPFSAVAC